VILDGLDGTANFSRGLPLFCSAVAILVDDQARVGAMYDPIHNVVYSAVLPGPYKDPTRDASASAWEIAAGSRIDLVALTEAGRAGAQVEAIGIHLTRADTTKLREFLACLETLAIASGAVYALNAGIPALRIARGGLGAFLNITPILGRRGGEVIVRAAAGPSPRSRARRSAITRAASLRARCKRHLHPSLLKLVSGTARRAGNHESKRRVRGRS